MEANVLGSLLLAVVLRVIKGLGSWLCDLGICDGRLFFWVTLSPCCVWLCLVGNHFRDVRPGLCMLKSGSTWLCSAILLLLCVCTLDDTVNGKCVVVRYNCFNCCDFKISRVFDNQDIVYAALGFYCGYRLTVDWLPNDTWGCPYFGVACCFLCFMGLCVW